jgi:hypothetical protein
MALAKPPIDHRQASTQQYEGNKLPHRARRELGCKPGKPHHRHPSISLATTVSHSLFKSHWFSETYAGEDNHSQKE